MPKKNNPRPRRALHAIAQQTESPPQELEATQSIAKVEKAAGNYLYNVIYASGESTLALLQAQFRSNIWIRNGSFVVIDWSEAKVREEDGKDVKVGGEIINVIRNEKDWRKARWWPAEFVKTNSEAGGSARGEESIVGKMPSSDSEDDI